MKNGPAKVLKQSMRHFILIEVTNTDEEVTNTDNMSTDSTETTDCDTVIDSSVNVHPIRSQRQAAVTGEAIHRS